MAPELRFGHLDTVDVCFTKASWQGVQETSVERFAVGI